MRRDIPRAGALLSMIGVLAGCAGAGAQPARGNARPAPALAAASAAAPASAIDIAKPALPVDVVRVIQARIAAGVYPGAVVGMIDAQGPRAYGFGVRSLSAGGSRQNTPDQNTLYEIGSITKVFTGVLLADMVLRGEVRLEAPVADYLPAEAGLRPYAGKPISLVSLSTHTSGLPNLPDNLTPANEKNPFADYSVPQLYDFLRRVELKRAPGEQAAYSNVGVGLLGHVLALRAGIPFQQLLSQRVLGVLGLSDTTATPSESLRSRLAIGTDEGREVEAWDVATLDAAGGLRSTAHDLLAFLAAEMNRVDKPLRAAMALGREVQYRDAGGRSAAGLGWGIRTQPDPEVLMHGGGTGGYTTFMAMRRSGDLGVVFLTNAAFVDVSDVPLHLLDPSQMLRQWLVPTDEAALRAAQGRNLIADGHFSNGPGSWSAGDSSTPDTLILRDGALCRDIVGDQPQTAIGWPTEPALAFRVQAGRHYRLFLRGSATASPPLKLQVNVGHRTAPYTPAAQAEGLLTAQSRVYAFEFTPDHADADVGVAITLMRWQGQGKTSACIDDVVVVEE